MRKDRKLIACGSLAYKDALSPVQRNTCFMLGRKNVKIKSIPYTYTKINIKWIRDLNSSKNGPHVSTNRM